MSLKDLEHDDWVALCRFDKKTGVLDFNDIMKIENPTSRERLAEAELVEANGKLTENGLKYANAMLQKIEPFKKGVPFDKRPKTGLLGPDLRKTLADFMQTKWHTGNVRKKACFTNSDIFYIGRPPGRVKLLEINGQKMSKMLATNLQSKVISVTPYAYQLLELGGVSVIWLKGDGLTLAIQVGYFDFLTNRFQTGKFFASNEKSPVQIKVKNKGFKDDVAALIMPMANLKPPKI